MEDSPRSFWKPLSVLLGIGLLVWLGFQFTQPEPEPRHSGTFGSIETGGEAEEESTTFDPSEVPEELPLSASRVRLGLELVRLGDLDDADVMRPFAFSPFRGGVQGKIWSGVDGRGLEGVSVEIVNGPQKGRRTTSDVRGNYDFDRVPPGRLFLRFQSVERTPITHAVRIVEGQTTTHDVSLAMGHPLHGLVRSHAGDRLAGVVVEADGVTVETGASGTFLLEGVGGGTPTYVYLTKKGYRTERLVVDLSEPRTTKEEPLVVHLFEGGSIQIDIQGYRGDIPPRVSILPREGHLNGEVAFEKLLDLEGPLYGGFTVDGLPERGIFRVLLHHPRAIATPAEQLVYMAGGRSVRKVSFQLEAGARIAGRVVSQVDGEGLKDVRVRIEPADPWALMEQGLGEDQADRLPLPSFSAWSVEAETNWNGEFVADAGVHAESWRVVAEREGFEPAVEVVPAKAIENLAISLKPHERNQGILAIRLRPGVDLEWTATVDGMQDFASGTADLGERFQIPNLPPGKYRVHPKWNDVDLPPYDVEVPRSSRGIADLDIDLAR